MIAIIEKENFINFKKELKGCTNIKRKTFHNKELIVSWTGRPSRAADGRPAPDADGKSPAARAPQCPMPG